MRPSTLPFQGPITLATHSTVFSEITRAAQYLGFDESDYEPEISSHDDKTKATNLFFKTKRGKHVGIGQQQKP